MLNCTHDAHVHKKPILHNEKKNRILNEQLKSISIFMCVRRIVHIISKCEHRILIFQSRQNSSKCQSNKTRSFCIDKKKPFVVGVND